MSVETCREISESIQYLQETYRRAKVKKKQETKHYANKSSKLFSLKRCSEIFNFS